LDTGLIREAIEGNDSIFNREDFQSLDTDEVISGLKLILQDESLSLSQKRMLISSSWRIAYRVKPPTIEEFLTPDWIGPMADSLYPHVRDTLVQFWKPDSNKRHLVLGTAIGSGKSILSTLSAMYVTIQLWCMRNPKRFFGLAQSTSIVQALISFTMKKAEQLLLQPFMQILLSSPKFHRVKQEEHVKRHQEENPDLVCWTSAGKMGSLQFYNDIHYVIASSPASLLGLNLIMAILSEISFFIDQGFSPEYIWRIYQDSKSRVRSRFGDRRLSGTIIDSSPNDIELSPIDKWIFSGEADQDPLNLVLIGSLWEFLPDKFPIWKHSGETFPVFRGSSGKPAKVLTDGEVESYPKEEVMDIPIDLKQLFIDNTLKNVKDFGGWPSGSIGVLIRDENVVNRMFLDGLKNVYTFIYAPDDRSSIRLIFDSIAPTFFVRYDKGLEFWRYPDAVRYLHVDQAEVHDMASISMVHPEWCLDTEQLIYVTDFTIPISPKKARINLDAIRLFIEDLWKVGRMNIGKVTFDQYQSKATISYLHGIGMNVDVLSVDRDPNIYLTYVSMIQSGRVYAGRNIFLKNNLLSLQEVTQSSGKKKIDHTIGKVVYEDHGKWESSFMGKFAKDVSDSNCGAVWNALHDFTGIAPSMSLEDLTPKKGSDILTQKDIALKKALEKYGFTPRGG